jgi:hypothetical protein
VGQALDLIAERFLATIQAHGPEAILPLNHLGSMGIVQRRALMRIFHALGTSRLTDAVCAGVVLLPGKWWGRAGELGAVANLLTASAWSPGGQPAYNDTFVTVADAYLGEESHEEG